MDQLRHHHSPWIQPFLQGDGNFCFGDPALCGFCPCMDLSWEPFVCCPHSITAINCYTVSRGWKFLSPEDFSGFWIYFWYSTHVMNYLLSSVGCQVIDNVKVEPSKGHGPHHLIVAELQVSVIRPRCHNKVVSLSHRWGPASHIQCSVVLIKLCVLSSTASGKDLFQG